MGKGDLFGRILRGRTEPKKQEEKSETPVQPPAVDPVERVLNVPLSRRNILGGAATSAAHAAHMATMPQAPIVIQHGVKEAAALLAPRLTSLLSSTDQILRLSTPLHYKKEVKLGEYEETGEIAPTLEEAFKLGLPMTNTGRLDRQRFFEMSWLGKLGLPADLKLSDLKNAQIITEAARLGGDKRTPSTDVLITQTKHAVEILQRVTGVSDQQTIGDLQQTFGNNVATIAKKILENPELFPTSAAADERGARQTTLHYFKDTLSYIGGEKAHPELAERVRIESEQDRLYYTEQDRLRDEERARTRQVSEGGRNERREGQIQERLDEKNNERERFNRDLKEREDIECSVQNAVREPRDNINAKVFLIKPENYEGVGEFHGLTRMHIQHLRQILTLGKKGRGLKQPTLDNFDEANTTVEMLGDVIRVSTTDGKFQKYLGSFVGDEYKMLRIPNRLQMVTPPEKEEN